MHFISEYGLFLAKSATVIICLLILITGIQWIMLLSKMKEKNGKLIIQKINDKLRQYEEIINDATFNKIQKKRFKKNQKKLIKSSEKQTKNRLFILNFDGDIKATAVHSLREEITAILLTKKPGDQVLLCVESPGGLVHAYGLAAAQIQRLKNEHIKLTIAIDKVAASGGYLMACIADHIIAAPFAIVGSIGVIAQLPNFHRWLENKDIDFEQITAGQYKRTLTLFGENTPEGREKMQQEINEAHELFKEFIEKYRPIVNIEQVSTGEHWFATKALELKLVDEIKTSDEFLLSQKDLLDIYKVKYEFRKTMSQRLSFATSKLLSQFIQYAP